MGYLGNQITTVFPTSTSVDTSTATTLNATNANVTGALSAKGGAVFNEDSADVDFRVESNNQANMLLVDGGNDTVSFQPNSGTLTIKAGSGDATNNVRLEGGGTTSTYLEYRGYLGHQFYVDTTERMRIISNGFVKHGNTGSYRSATSTFHEFRSSENNVNLVIDSTNASLSADIVNFIALRASSGGNWVFLSCFSGNGADREFRIDGDGTTHADGSYSSSGGDYAEMFEWKDGNTSNEDRVGKTVVLEGNQIRLSTSDDAQSSIIGVVSARPIVLGDAHSERWSEKFEKDVYGRYVFEEYTQTEWTEEDENGEKTLKSFQTDQIPNDETVPSDAIVTSTEDDGKTPLMRRKLNTDFDPSQTYIPREKRKEFSAIGLVGKLRVNADQAVGDRWIKMREISDTIHEYLVR